MEDYDVTDAVGELIRKSKERHRPNETVKALKWVIVILVVLALILLLAKNVMA